MPTVTLTFTEPINVSAAIDDLCYYTPTANSGGFPVSNQNQLVLIGTILTINRVNNTITCDSTLNDGDIAGLGAVFVLFAKDNKSNLSSMLGYYSKMKFVNDDTRYAELFSIGVDTFISSK